MKNSSTISLLALVIATFFSCDKIPLDKVKNKPLQLVDCAEGKEVTNNSDSTSTVKKIYLEYFTGHLCGNCPGSSGPAFNQIEEAYPSKVVVTKIHADFFARTTSKYTNNFTTPTGDKIFRDNNVTSVPSGMIDRIAFKGNKLNSPSEWINAVSLRNQTQPVVKLILNSGYCPESRSLVVNAKLEFLQAYNEPVSIVGYISEDNIIGMQLDYEKNPKDVPDFVHKYVLRNELSIIKPFSTTQTSNKGSIATGSLGVNLKSDWKEKQTYIIVLVTNQKSGEVLQVEKIKIYK